MSLLWFECDFIYALDILITPPSGRGLVVPIFYPAVRTGSSNTLFFYYPAVRTGSSNTRFFYYFPFFWWSLAPDLRFLLGQTYSSRLSLHRLELVSRVTIISFTPRGEGGNGGVMPLGLFLFSIFLVVTCPRPPVSARPNRLVTSSATQARACILSDHNIFYIPRGGENGGAMPLGLFLFSLCFTYFNKKFHISFFHHHTGCFQHHLSQQCFC